MHTLLRSITDMPISKGEVSRQDLIRQSENEEKVKSTFLVDRAGVNK